MDYNELSDLSVTFGSQNKDSHILNAENTLSVIADLSTTAEHQLSTKIYIKDPGVPELSDGTYGKDLSVIKMPIDEYELSVVGGTLSDGVLYVVSADYIDVYSQEIRSLSTPGAVGTSNAANILYVDEAAENLKTLIDLSCDQLNDKIDQLCIDLSGEIDDLCADLCIAIDNKSNIYLSSISSDQSLVGEKLERLNLIRFDSYETYTARKGEVTILSSDLVCIEEENLNAYDKRVISVATPTESNDAATKGYVDTIKTGLSSLGTHSTLSSFVENTDDEIKIDDLKDVLKTLIRQLSSIS